MCIRDRTFNGLLMIHPHLEGNGRTSRLYLQHIAARAGYQIDWTQVPAPVLIDATIAAFRLEPDALQRILRNIVHPLHDTDPAEHLRQRMREMPPPGTPATHAPPMQAPQHLSLIHI